MARGVPHRGSIKDHRAIKQWLAPFLNRVETGQELSQYFELGGLDDDELIEPPLCVRRDA